MTTPTDTELLNWVAEYVCEIRTIDDSPGHLTLEIICDDEGVLAMVTETGGNYAAIFRAGLTRAGLTRAMALYPAKKNKNMKCKNCGASPPADNVILERINPLGIIGEWICNECFDSMELFEEQPHYVHSKNCPNYCDYACNGQFGFDLAEQVKTYYGKRIQATSDQLKP